MVQSKNIYCILIQFLYVTVVDFGLLFILRNF